MCQEAHLQLINSQGFYVGLSTYNFTVQKNKMQSLIKTISRAFSLKSDVVKRWTIRVFNIVTSGRMNMCQYYKKKMKEKTCGRKKKNHRDKTK